MTIVRRESLAEQAAALLHERIRAGEWPIGGKLPGETTLAPQLGVGRSTAREAIRILAGRGILATRQGAGVFVVAAEAPEGWGAVLQRAGIAAVLEARTAIEVEAAALAARRRTAAELETLRIALEERQRRRGDLDALVDADMAVHRGIVAAAHSPILLELFDGFAPRSRAAMIDMLRSRAAAGAGGDRSDVHGAGSDPRSGDADHDAHEQMYLAIEAGDADAAARLTRAHLQTLRSRAS
ncbi:FadR/GntR family transcriptional regulator [Leucobacter chromiiresistens]|uniref:DNA-binding transcriptional regulator, FadR family n=1 Tax=Leucobacter chromiiresistens TaxID=1079994 RepID=A0A1H0YE05_9MICO|nr:FCD domain-containing protein [Leucobacter chromiiresistens]SDQ13181.1 DNA-binding transcriptional regulator, FadR family [Leucobacter chromiiresistens]